MGNKYSVKEKKRFGKILAILQREYSDSRTALHYANPFQLLIATMLSAQCTDKRVNTITNELFKKYKRAADFAMASQTELEREIRSTGFFRNKAKNIRACCKAIAEEHGGQVPRTMKELTSLAGVGRKTANCVLGGAFGIKSGIVVDTHVKRLSKRLGLTEHDDPERIEEDLMQLVPQESWYHFSNMLIWHGRRVCKARKPDCSECPLSTQCPTAEAYLNKL